MKFAAVKLLRRAPVELTEKRHLRELLLLALRVAALVLLALRVRAAVLSVRRRGRLVGVTVVALDTSYSMSAPGRIERARQLAADAIARAPAGDLVGVLTFADVADVVAKPSADRALALSAVSRVAAGFGATRYRAGLSAAAQALAGRRGTIVVVTDLQESGWDAGDRASVPESARIEVADVGAPPPNLAVTSVRPAGDRVAAAVRNTDSRARETRVRLMLDGRPAGEMTVSVGPNASAEVAFPLAARASTAEVAIDDRDGLQADNVRYAVLDEARPAVGARRDGHRRSSGREAFYVQQALGAGGAAPQAYQVDGASGAQLSAWDAARLSSRAAVVLLSTRGLERRGREALAAYARGGGGILIAAGPDIDGEVVADVLGAGAPLRIMPPADAKPDAASRGADAGAGRRAASDLPAVRRERGDARAREVSERRAHRRIRLPDARAVHQRRAGADRLSGGRGPRRGDRLRSRQSLERFSAAPDLRAVPARGRPLPGERTPACRRVSGRRRAGGHAAHAGDCDDRRTAAAAPAAARRVAINVDPREGDPARISVDEFQSAVTRLKDVGASEARVDATQQEDRQHLWQYVLVDDDRDAGLRGPGRRGAGRA